jgi:catechol 2,3-dioxygenase
METIHPATTIGYVHLTVSRLEAMKQFYGTVLGFQEAQRDGARTIFLSATGGCPFHIGLTEAEDPTPPPSRAAGLYHLAVLLPSRRDLARLFRRVLRHGVRIDGAADHSASEAIYFRDPEGNGIEIYADRDRGRWIVRGEEIVLTSDPLDLEALLAEATDADAAASGAGPEACIGHVHLRVSDLDRAEAFYHGALGFQVTTRAYPGALFFSAGGYHHHIATNIWAGRGIPRAPVGRPGLRYFTIRLPSQEEADRVLRSLTAGKIPIEATVDHEGYRAISLRDLDGIGVALTLERKVGSPSPQPSGPFLRRGGTG